MKLLWIAVALCALFVASIVANEIADIDGFGYWALLFLIWPTVLYLASRQHDDIR